MFFFQGIFISEIKSLPSLYSVEANIAYITMEESMGDATGESDLDNADLATYIGGYQRFQAAIIRVRCHIFLTIQCY